MKLAFAIAVLAMGAAATQSQVTPVKKVIQLLSGMLEKGKAAKHDDQVQFAEYKQFCDDTSSEKKYAIEKAAEKIEMLQADIQQGSANAAKLTKEIAHLEKDVSVWQGDKKAATKVREMEKADYDATHADYTETLDALMSALNVLRKEAYDRKQKESFAQVSALKSMNLIPPSSKAVIDAFLSTGAAEDAASGFTSSAPEANAYEFQSNAVVDMLEKLQEKFTDEQRTLEKEEANSKHAYDMLMQDLEAQISHAEQDRDEKVEAKATILQAKADSSGDLEDESAAKKEDETYLSDLTSTCTKKAADFESRQSLRSEELEAIEKAIEIISGAAVSDNAEKHLPKMLVQQDASSFPQLRAEGRRPVQSDAAMYLQQKAKALNSRVLSALAERVNVDPFGKVKKMLKDMINRLMDEANEEADHKGYCDTELSTNEQTRKEKAEAVDMLHAEIDELASSLAQLTEDVGSLSKALAELDAAMAKATSMRQKEKAENSATVKDAQEAQTAVAQAVAVLEEFYAKAGEATAFLQQPYKGMQGDNSGVLGMLEVIESDFARLEADTSASEATGQKEYDEFMTVSKEDKAAKSTESEHKSSKIQDQQQALTEKKSDLEGMQKELDAALAYFDKLKPSCVDAGVSYEDRVARRKEEIESLQESLRILNNEAETQM